MKGRNVSTTVNYTAELGKQIEFRGISSLFLSGVQGMTITGSIDFYNDSQYHINARNSSLILSSTFDAIYVSGNFQASGSHTLTGSLVLFDNITFWQNKQYHINASASHLILSSSTGTVHVSGNFKTSGSIQWANSSLGTGQGGSIELGNGLIASQTPFIDFHFGVGFAQDYNARIINQIDQRMDFMLSASSANAQISFSSSANIHSRTGHLILSSSAGSVVKVSGGFRIGNDQIPNVLVANSYSLGIGTATPVARLHVALTNGSGTLTGSIAHFETGLGTTPVTIGRSSNTGSEVISIKIDDTNAYFDVIQDESITHLRFRMTTGSTGTPGMTDLLRLQKDQLGGRVGINKDATVDDLEVNGDIQAAGGFRIVVDGQRLNSPANVKTEMSGADITGAGAEGLTLFVAPFAGSIIGITCAEKTAATSAQPITFSASINRVANATAKLALAASKASGSVTFAKDAIPFQAGDRIGLFMATQTGHTTTTDWRAWLTLEM